MSLALVAGKAPRTEGFAKISARRTITVAVNLALPRQSAIVLTTPTGTKKVSELGANADFPLLEKTPVKLPVRFQDRAPSPGTAATGWVADVTIFQDK